MAGRLRRHGPGAGRELKKGGIEATYVHPPDMFTRFQKGDYQGMLFGHGGSVNADPYDTMKLYQSASLAIPGGHAVNFSKWKNAGLRQDRRRDGITPVDRSGQTARSVQARDGDLVAGVAGYPDPAVVPPHSVQQHQLDRLAKTENAYVNGAFWHLTFQLILNELKPTAA